jgi:hypothetical protein
MISSIDVNMIMKQNDKKNKTKQNGFDGNLFKLSHAQK